MVKRGIEKKEEIHKEKAEEKKKLSHYSMLKEVFKTTRFDSRYWKTFFIGLALLIVSSIVFLFFAYYGASSVRQNFDLSALEAFLSSAAGGTPDETLVAAAAPILGALLGFVFLALIVNLFISTGFKGWIWKKVFGEKMNFKFYWKYLGFRLVFGISIMLALVIGVFTGPGIVVFLIGAILLYHLFCVSLIYFIRNNKIWKSIGQGFRKGLRVHLFLLPYLFFVGLFLAQYIITNLILFKILVGNLDMLAILQLVNDIPLLVRTILPFAIISGIIGLLFISYMRIFYAEFVKRI